MRMHRLRTIEASPTGEYVQQLRSNLSVDYLKPAADDVVIEQIVLGDDAASTCHHQPTPPYM